MINYGPSDEKTTRWWSRKSDAHKCVTDLIGAIRARQTAKRKMDQLHAKIYGNYDVAGQGHLAATAYEILRGEDGRMRYLVSAPAVDTMMAILTSNKPVPYYLTEGATWTEQRRAKRKAKIVAGQMLDLGVYKIARNVTRDALVFGTGLAYGYVDDDNRVGIEKVQPCEVTVDHAEAMSGAPRSMFRTRLMPREQACLLWPKHDGAIRASSGPTQQDWEDRHMKQDTSVDMVLIHEAWHLESSRGAGDGRYVVCTDTVTLASEPWNRDWFPFAEMRWKDRLSGWWGCGLIEETKAAQLRCNKLVKRFEALQNMTNAYVFVPQGSGVQEHEITNAPLQIIPYNPAAGAPQFFKFDASPQDLRAELGAITEDTFRQVGISMAQLQGEKPAGLKSAVAIRAAEDIGSRRHVDNIRQYEDFFVSMTQLLERLNDVAAENDPDYSVASLETRGRTEVMRRIKWTDVRTKSPSTVRMFPVSALGNTPAGKMESVQELVQGGYLNRNYALKLLDFPDLDSAMAMELVDIDLVHYHLDQIQDGERGVSPLPFMNLDLAWEETRKVRAHAELLEASETVKRDLERYWNEVKMLIEMAQPPAPPPAAMPPPMQAPPGAPPPDMAQAMAPVAA